MKLSEVITQSAPTQKLKLSDVTKEQPSALKGGLPFSPFGIDTGLTMPESVSNVVAGVGKGMSDLVQGAGQHLGIVPQSDVKLTQQRDQELMNTTGGKVGNVAGNVAIALPTAFIPGANTYTGAALTGAALGALQPVPEGSVIKETAKNAGIGAAGGVAGQALGQGVGELARRYGVRRAAIQAARQTANAEKDATQAAAQQAGYVIPPAMTEGNTTGKILNGLSGKAKTEQLARVRNQRVTDRLAREALNLPDDIPITADVTGAVRQAAFDVGYRPVAAIGQINTDAQFTNALNRITQQRAGAIRSFPDAAQNDVAALVDQYRVPNFLAEDGISQIQIIRNQASDAFRAGNTQMGHALRDLSGALEDQMERHLTNLGQDGAGMLREFRAARRLMARSHTVEDAIREGSGSVDAAAFGRALQRGEPLTDHLETIGRFANNYKEAARMPGGADANPLTVLDFTTGSLGAGLSASSPAGLALLGMPAARVAARYGALSGAGQRALTQPNYGPTMLQRVAPMLQSDTANAITRLLPPSVYAGQQ